MHITLYSNNGIVILSKKCQKNYLLAKYNEKNSILSNIFNKEFLVLNEALHLLTQEYTLILATTKEDISAVKKIRKEILLPKYQNFATIEDEDLFLFNKDDEQSFIYLLRHNPTQTFVGTIRVFFLNSSTPIQKLPMQKDGHVEGIEYLTKDLPICEVSRLALSTNLSTYKDFSTLQLRTYLSMALMAATRINFFLYHYSKIFAIMERSLQRILKRQNVYFEQIGNAVDYYGMRFPFVIKKENFLVSGEETEGPMGMITRYYLKELCQNPEALWQFIDNHPYLERSDIHLDRICQVFKEHGNDVDLSILLKDQKVDLTA